MSDSFNVAIISQDYPPAVIQRLAGLLNISPRKLAARLERADLVVKKNVDETTAQQYAAIIYEKTGAEASVTGGPDLNDIQVSKPAVTKAADSPPQQGLRWPPGLDIRWRPSRHQLWAGLAALSLILITALVLVLRPGPGAAIDEALTALEENRKELLLQRVALKPLLSELYPALHTLPAFEGALADTERAAWAESATHAILSGTSADNPALARLLAMLGQPEADQLAIALSRKDDKAQAEVAISRPDLERDFLLLFALAHKEGGWQITRWTNAAEVLHAINEAEQARLLQINTEIEAQLDSIVTDFRYTQRVAGAHRFSLGQLLIEGSFTNSSNQSLREMSGHIFVYGLDSGHRYASKPFLWQASKRLAPPGGRVRVEVFYSLDGAFPELVSALENKTEALDIGYAIESLTFRDNRRLRTFTDYAAYQASEPRAQ